MAALAGALPALPGRIAVEMEGEVEHPVRRPVVVTLTVAVVAINGLVSLSEGLGAPLLGTESSAQAVIPGILGLALLHRAYALWNYHRSSWVTTVVLLGIRTVLVALSLALGEFGAVGWVNLAIVAGTLLYLLRPEVKGLFRERRERM